MFVQKKQIIFLCYTITMVEKEYTLAELAKLRLNGGSPRPGYKIVDAPTKGATPAGEFIETVDEIRDTLLGEIPGGNIPRLDTGESSRGSKYKMKGKRATS